MISSSGENSQQIQMPMMSLTNNQQMQVLNKQDMANLAETDPSLSKFTLNNFKFNS